VFSVSSINPADYSWQMLSPYIYEPHISLKNHSSQHLQKGLSTKDHSIPKNPQLCRKTETDEFGI